MLRPLLCLLPLALAGCMTPTGVDASAVDGTLDAALRLVPEVVLDVGVFMDPSATELDVLCAMGGGVELPRVEGVLIAPGVAALEAVVRVPPTTTGMQLGVSLDDGPVRWLPVVGPGQTGRFTLEVAPEEVETTAERWSFHQQHNVFLAPQGCYTGASAFGWNVHVETVPAE